MSIRNSIIVSFIMMCFSSGLNAQEERTITNKWYMPDHIRLQYAGHIGLISSGPAWTLLKNNFELAYSIGYVPEFAGGRDIYIAAFKGIYIPKLYFNIKKTIIKPLSAGAVFNYTFGERYSKYNGSKNYPKGYLWWNTSFRMGLLLESEIYVKIKQKHMKGLGFYIEASFWDLYILSLFDNHNSSYINLWDITTLGLGIKIYFR